MTSADPLLPMLLHEEFLAPGSVVLTLKAPAALSWFQGHFPRQAILPGVAQLVWAEHYAQCYLAEGQELRAIPALKYLCPILPDSTLSLRLSYVKDKDRVDFAYEIVNDQNRVSATSGSLKFAKAACCAS
ncbi:MAG: hypothetical protein IJ228_00590 [Succinivibrio sp.]|nr:hypothetical protein [Succinivibrio sp.]